MKPCITSRKIWPWTRRQFFYGQKRSQRIRTQSSFQMKRLARLEKRKDGVLGGGRSGGKGDYDVGGMAIGDLMEADHSLTKVRRAKKSLSANAPMPASEALAEESFADSKEGFSKRENEAQKQAPGQEDQAVQVRSDFRSTILWNPSIKTGRDGKATVKIKFSDSLTQWRATARAVSKTNQFGIDTTKVRTQNPLIVRLQSATLFRGRGPTHSIRHHQ